MRFKLDATPAWDDHLLETLAEGGLVEVVDFKGVYQGTLAEAHTDAELCRRVAEATSAPLSVQARAPMPVARSMTCLGRGGPAG